MKAYLLFTSAFLEWPLAIERELQRHHPGSAIPELATGHPQIAQRVTAATDVGAAPLDYIDDLERRWLATPIGPAELARYEKIAEDFDVDHLMAERLQHWAALRNSRKTDAAA